MSFIEPGSPAWFKDGGLWHPCTAGPSDGTSQTFKSNSGQTFTIDAANIGPQTCTPMHRSSIDTVEDMALLGDLHEGAILLNIKKRYDAGSIYTYIGSILAAMNPYKKIEGVYGDEKVLEYKDIPIGELPPHIYALANEAYFSLWKKDRNQVMLISGESGAGKTESTKHILSFLSYLSNQVAQSTGKKEGSSFEDRVLKCNPILEAYGNGKTVYNNNSSRFGKFISINFSNGGFIEGGKVIDYLLEKNRVVRQNEGERSFHIFYNITSEAQDPKYKLAGAETYGYLKQSGVITDKNIDDVGDWARVKDGYASMGFSEAQQENMMNCLAAILHLGNIEFTQAGGAQISDPSVVKIVAELLSVDANNLTTSLTNLVRTVRGEVMESPLDIPQAKDVRDSLSMGIYRRLFAFIIAKCNTSLKGAETFHSIGVLDIFGFENFKVNFLEQFNINYANEKLQQYFNRHIFSLEQLEYEREGIPWDEIDFVDNGACLDLIERKLGVISLVDEESKMKAGTDESLLLKMHKSCTEMHGSDASNFYIKPRVNNGKFGIKHYAGDVMYESVGLCEKNKDGFREDLVALMTASENDFMFDLFEADGATTNSGRARKKASLCVQFKDSLGALMKILGAANPYFVRCLKPNMEKIPDNFQDPIVHNQLRYSGMLETVRIRRAGYPVRREFADFLFRYRPLTAGKPKDGVSEADQCAAVFKEFDASNKEWKIGSNKAFFREKIEIQLEARRAEALKETVKKIQAAILSTAAKIRFNKIRSSSVRIQAWWRGANARKQFLLARHSQIIVSAHYRGYKARQLYVQMREEKRLADEAKREIERQKEEDRLAARARAEEQARREEEARAAEIKKLEEEAKANAEAAEALKQAKAAAEEARKAEEAAAAARKAEAEAEAKAKAEAASTEAADEAALIADAKAKAAALGAEQDKARAAKELQEEAARLAAEMEAKAAKNEEDGEDEDYEGAGADDDNLDDEGDFDDFDDGGFEDYKEGYLGMFKGGMKKRWCVMNDGVLMWFKGAQNFIKAGWLTKMGGGSSTLGRKSWKRRWMTLKGGELHYHPSEEEDATILGVVDIQGCEKIVDGENEKLPIKKDFAFSIITKKRTYFMCAESDPEREEWVATLKSVMGKSAEEIMEMQRSSAVDPRNAVGSLELDDIIQVGALDKTYENKGLPMFVVMCSNAVHKFVCQDEDDMDDWIRVLTPNTGISGGDGSDDDVTCQGFLKKGGGDKGLPKKRYFMLRGDVLSYYKGQDVGSFVASIPLNSLCAVIPPDEEEAAKTNVFRFVLHARRKSFVLFAKSMQEMNKWISALNDVIDNCPIIETPLERMIDELKVATAAEVEAMYQTQKGLTYSNAPLRVSLLPLPYGETVETPSGRKYGTLQVEALKVSASLLPAALTGDMKRYGDPKEPVPLIKAICQLCFDVKKLQNEVYCQVIKITSGMTEPGSPLNLVHWALLGAMCVSFLPARKFVRFLRFHLRRTIELNESEEVVTAAKFCLEAIKSARGARDFPPSTEEIKSILNGSPLKCTVHAVGDVEPTDVEVTSNTTCGEVIATVKEKLQLTECSNGFGLFEGCGDIDKYLDERTLVADVLSKWEKYEAHGINAAEGEGDRWKFVFKLFSFYDPLNPNLSKVEKEFLFEQAHESVMKKQFPTDEAGLVKLAALRTQYVVGDYEEGAYISDLVKVHPAQSAALMAVGGGISGTLKKAGTLAKKALKGTLRGFGSSTLRKLKGQGTIKKSEQISEEELSKIKAAIVQEWQRYKGMTADDARLAYMDEIHGWNGYASNLFNVEQVSKKEWPKELWLAISLEGVGIYPRGERKCLAFHRYESVLSFGAPVANKYKIMVDNVGSMLFDTDMVLEIAKLMKEYIKAIVTRKP